tara:strand:+ start:828 stop:2642 length:1815 start_codon:yes stop_codon:yes gene_type:complete
MKIIDFIKEIGVPEFKSIIGNIDIKGKTIYGTNIVLLVVILFLSLLALGIAEGSLSYLKTKMEDPYVNFIDIPKPIHQENSKIINKKILEKDIVSKNFTFLIDKKTKKPSVFETRQKNIRFIHKNNKKTLSGFILKTDNIFYERINKIDEEDPSKNMLVSNNTFHNDSWGIIVTEDFLKDFGMDLSTPYVYISSGSGKGNKNYIFPVPIAGVVKQLRRKQEFILSEKLYYLLTKHKDKIKEILTDDNQAYIRYFIPGYEVIPDTLRKLGFTEQFKSSRRSISHVKGMIIESPYFEHVISDSFVLDSSKFTKLKTLQTQVDELDTKIKNDSILMSTAVKKVKWNNKLAAIIQAEFSTKKYNQILDSVAAKKKDESIAILEEEKGVLKEDIKALIEAKITRIYNLDAIALNLKGLAVTIDPECYTVLFNDLEKVAVFDKYIKARYNIPLEKSTIEDKKNFSFFNNLSNLLSWCIILFSIISIAFFTLNLLFSHINKNKRNLGTLKAFGLPNSSIVVLYSVITLLLVSISFAIAYSLSSLLGQSCLNLYTTSNEIDSANYISEVVFVNYNIKQLLGFMVVVPTVCILIGLYLKLYKVTPGDLIYERK